MNMSRSLLTLIIGTAAIIGGLYLYKKYGGKRRNLIAHGAGMALGHEVGGTAGQAIGGPIGAIVGGAVGAAAGVVAAHDYFGD